MEKALHGNDLANRSADAVRAEKEKIPEWLQLFLIGAACGTMIGLLLGLGLLGG